MNIIKSAQKCLSGPKSDLYLFFLVLILANIAGSMFFFRVDLTSRGSYSLSRASRETVATLAQPLTVEVFFSKNLPAPYNGVSRYLEDLLVEYKGAANREFSYTVHDMDSDEGKRLASDYGINVIQVQEVKDNEIGFKNVYMGLALAYSDTIEVMDGITDSSGLEYRLTTAIGKMIARANTLSLPGEKATLTLYLSNELGAFGINGFDKVPELVSSALGKLNKASNDMVEFKTVHPESAAEVEGITSRYGLPKISWGEEKTVQAGVGVIGLVLEYGDRFRTVPLSVARSLFGGYAISGLDVLDDTLTESFSSLVQNSLTVGYVTGHGERSLSDEKGSPRLRAVLGDLYEFTELDLGSAEIPAAIQSLVINGPKTAFSEVELRRIDQFVMKGGNVLFLMDPFEQIESEMAYYGVPPTYTPVQTNLETLLSAWGVDIHNAYVMDSECYVARQQGSGDVPLYYVPIIGKKGMNGAHPVSRNLLDVIFLETGEISLNGKGGEGVRALPLVTTSAQSWKMEGEVSLSPYAIVKPAPDTMKEYVLAASLEGMFKSAFTQEAESDTADSQGNAQGNGKGGLSEGSAHLVRSVMPARIIVVGTSAITGNTVFDETGSQPVAVFFRNALDYLNGNDDFIDMRTKGLTANPLNKAESGVKTLVSNLNLYALPAIAALAGLIVWRRRISRKRAIRKKYGDLDSREKEAK